MRAQISTLFSRELSAGSLNLGVADSQQRPRSLGTFLAYAVSARLKISTYLIRAYTHYSLIRLLGKKSKLGT